MPGAWPCHLLSGNSHCHTEAQGWPQSQQAMCELNLTARPTPGGQGGRPAAALALGPTLPRHGVVRGLLAGAHCGRGQSLPPPLPHSQQVPAASFGLACLPRSQPHLAGKPAPLLRSVLPFGNGARCSGGFSPLATHPTSPSACRLAGAWVTGSLPPFAIMPCSVLTLQCLPKWPGRVGG